MGTPHQATCCALLVSARASCCAIPSKATPSNVGTQEQRYILRVHNCCCCCIGGLRGLAGTAVLRSAGQHGATAHRLTDSLTVASGVGFDRRREGERWLVGWGWIDGLGLVDSL